MESHLLQMRGLKPEAAKALSGSIKSHLLQMRGLKHHEQNFIDIGFCRIFYRCVD